MDISYHHEDFDIADMYRFSVYPLGCKIIDGRSGLIRIGLSSSEMGSMVNTVEFETLIPGGRIRSATSLPDCLGVKVI